MSIEDLTTPTQEQVQEHQQERDQEQHSNGGSSPSVSSTSSQSTKGKSVHYSDAVLTHRSASTSNLRLQNSSTPSLTSKKQHPGIRGKTATHTRSLSHTKLVATSKVLSPSSGSGMAVRPHLNRSKSSDVLMKSRQPSALKRNSRSFTKVGGLQPLTKTMSNQSLKSSKSTTSLKANIQIGAPSQIGLKSSSKKGKAILRLNDNDDDYEDVDDTTNNEPIPQGFDSDETISTSMISPPSQNVPSLYEQINAIVPDPVPTAQVDEVLDRADSNAAERLEVVEEGGTIDSAVSHLRQNLAPSTRSSTEDFSMTNNLYGGSLLLSQSTGLVRKVNPMSPANQRTGPGGEVFNSSGGPMHIGNSDQTIESHHSDSISGISFKANPMEKHKIAEPVITNKNVTQKNSYQPDQTIFNNLQRTNNQYLTTKKHQQQQQQQPHQQSNINHSINNGANNFSEFLRANQSSSSSTESYAHNLETRTQQRLWLQRESSLMDVTNLDSNRISNFSNLSLNNLMFAHNYNQSHANVRELQQHSQHPHGPHAPQHVQHLPQSIAPLTPLTPTGPSVHSNIAYQQPNNQEPPAGYNAVGGGGSGLLLMVQGSTQQTTIQSRTEFERLNREYLNVRRHLNPVGESLNRVNKYLNQDLKVAKTKKNGARGGGGGAGGSGQDIPSESTAITSAQHNTNANSFKEFSPMFQEKELEVSAMLGKLWHDGIISSASSSMVNMRGAIHPGHPPQPHQQQQRQVGHGGMSGNSQVSMRTSQPPPTTRAVKLAGVAGESQDLMPRRRTHEHLMNIDA
ncbi:TCO89 [[Candida] subhashii]|uniref:TCO89 n=1 Tax=[Candida] subhashii TaxID=561895 RepID=A0A8J5Q233_9ASCO|nr:TCO89 [[Candida] subhashii]KAG7660749.1 TCO89 [[Candida] subhashii]